MMLNGVNPAWSEALGAFFTLYLKLHDADRALVDELIDSVRHRRQPVLERPDWSAGTPLRGRLSKLGESGGEAIVRSLETENLDSLVCRLVGAMHIVRDVVDRYSLGPEDQHDYHLADLRVGQIVSELRRRYSGRRGTDAPAGPSRSLASDVEAPPRTPQPPTGGPETALGPTPTPTPRPAAPGPPPPAERSPHAWTPEHRARHAATIAARKAMANMQAAPQLRPTVVAPAQQ